VRFLIVVMEFHMPRGLCRVRRVVLMMEDKEGRRPEAVAHVFEVDVLHVIY
jgi:hypothetical protein